MQGAAHIADLEDVDQTLRFASAPTRELFLKVAAGVSRSHSPPHQSAATARIDRLIDIGAWTDAAIDLADLALPDWTMRRIACEQGEWLCSLSRRPGVPLTLDETVDAGNRVLALAILSALVAASISDAAAPRAVPSVPRVRPASGQLICCDNFA